jgi:DNA-binding transcriptional LysR family regulator
MHLTLRHLELFRLFAQTRSVTETARLLSVSQPAVSHTLKEIENQLGFPVFVRLSGRTRLTNEAMAVLPRIERILTQYESLRGYAEELVDARAGSLSIVTMNTLCAYVIPRAIALFREERELVHFRVDSQNVDSLTTEIKQERADIGFGFAQQQDFDVIAEPLLEMSMVCLVPAGHRLAGEKLVTPKHLAGESIIAQSSENPSGFALRQALGRNQREVFETNQSIAALHMVRSGLGVALVHPIVATWDTARELVAIPFDPDIRFTLALFYSRHKPVSRLSTHFVGKVRIVMQQLVEHLAGRGITCRLIS